MNPWAARATTAIAVFLAAVYLIAATGTDFPRTVETEPVSGGAAGYHGGKYGAQGSLDPVCQSKGCHDAYPHRKDRAESAFRNMHQEFADCLSCHGKEPETRWSGDPPGRGRRIRYDREATRGNDPHADLGRAIGCRKCHSESGIAQLKEKGMTKLPADQSDPVALRMLEGGPKRWAPLDLR